MAILQLFIRTLSNLLNFVALLMKEIKLEFYLKTSPAVLFSRISTPSGLAEWFADNVNSRGEFFTFSWNDTEENARLASKKTGEKVKFK